MKVGLKKIFPGKQNSSIFIGRAKDDDVTLERWNRLQRRKKFLTEVRRGNKDETEDRKAIHKHKFISDPKIAYEF